MTIADRATELAELDRYAERLWKADLPIADSVDATTIRLVWLTAGFSVTADRAAVGDYLCVLGREAIATLAHVPLPETTEALAALIDAGRLNPLPPCCPGEGYRLRLEQAHQGEPIRDDTLR